MHKRRVGWLPPRAGGYTGTARRDETTGMVEIDGELVRPVPPKGTGGVSQPVRPAPRGKRGS